MRSQVEVGSKDAAGPLGSSVRARTSLLITLVAGLMLAAVLLSSVAVAGQLPVGSFGEPGSGAGQMQNPGGLASDPSTGDVYVADTGNNRIDKFSAEGQFLLAFGWGVEDGEAELQTCDGNAVPCQLGLAGKGVGQLSEVVGIAVSPVDGDVYTLNRRDGRVQRFTAAGEYLEGFAGYGAEADELGAPFTAPRNELTVGSNGDVYVGDPGKGRTAAFDPTGAYAFEIEGVSGPLASDSAGHLFVALNGGAGIQVYAADGTFEREEVVPDSFEGVYALAVDPTSGNLLALTLTGFYPNYSYVLKELSPAGEPAGVTGLPGMTTPPESEAKAFGLAATGGHSFPEHLAGAVFVADPPAARIQVFAEGEPQQPRIGKVGPSSVGDDHVDLRAEVDPEGLATEYFVEYGSTAAYGAVAPAAPGNLAAGFAATNVGVHLGGLAPAATYHYKVVARNTLGTTETADQTFTTYATAAPLVLPDGRAYERVSPAEKANNDVEARGAFLQHGLAGTDEDGLAFVTVNGLPGSPTGAGLTTSVAKRGSGGWSSEFMSVPELNQTTLSLGQPIELSADLNKALVASRVALVPGARAGTNLYIHTLSPPGYQLVTPAGAGLALYEPKLNAVGAASDFSRVFFHTSIALTPDAPTNDSLYEWSEAGLRDVSILPGESEPDPAGVTSAYPELRPVSADGSAVVFTATTAAGQQVFRRAGGQTVEVSAPNPGVVDPAGRAGATFVGAAADGSSVFFTSSGKLTADANTGEDEFGDTDLAPNLYRYDVGTGELADLTVEGNGYERGAAVSNVVVAADGNVAYFIAEGGLAEGGLAEGATRGAPNLYRWSQGGGVRFIATVSSGDPLVSGSSLAGLEGREVEANASGSAFAFVSVAGLAGHAAAAGTPEIYLWSTGEGLVCVSCGTGVIENGALMPGSSLRPPGGTLHGVTEDGTKVFFTAGDALVGQDTDGKEDVYEWEGGAAHLISTGEGNYGSYFIDASPSGKDVFFATRSKLVKSDTDGLIDVYDAREGGGFAESESTVTSCEAEACRPPLSAAPAAAQLGSRGFTGPGDKKPKKQHHKKHKRKKHHKKKHHKSKSHKHRQRGDKSHKAHSGGKRG